MFFKKKPTIKIVGKGEQGVTLTFKNISLEKMTVFNMELTVAVAKQLKLSPKEYLGRLVVWEKELRQHEQKVQKRSALRSKRKNKK